MGIDKIAKIIVNSTVIMHTNKKGRLLQIRYNNNVPYIALAIIS